MAWLERLYFAVVLRRAMRRAKRFNRRWGRP
jgi:hypothetical protein